MTSPAETPNETTRSGSPSISIELTEQQADKQDLPQSIPSFQVSTEDLRVSYTQTVMLMINGYKARALLDTGATMSFISENLAEKLDLPGHPTSMGFYAANQERCECSGQYQATVMSLSQTFGLHITLYGLRGSQNNPTIPRRSITTLAPQSLTPEEHDWLNKIGFPISDITESEVNNYPVEIILGIDVYNKIWYTMPLALKCGLSVQLSTFGWIISGVISRDYRLLNSLQSCFFMDQIPKLLNFPVNGQVQSSSYNSPQIMPSTKTKSERIGISKDEPTHESSLAVRRCCCPVNNIQRKNFLPCNLIGLFSILIFSSILYKIFITILL